MYKNIVEKITPDKVSPPWERNLNNMSGGNSEQDLNIRDKEDNFGIRNADDTDLDLEGLDDDDDNQVSKRYAAVISAQDN